MLTKVNRSLFYGRSVTSPSLSIPICTIHNNIHEQEYHSDKGPLFNTSFPINGPFHPVHNSVFGNELVLLIVGPRKSLNSESDSQCHLPSIQAGFICFLHLRPTDRPKERETAERDELLQLRWQAVVGRSLGDMNCSNSSLLCRYQVNHSQQQQVTTNVLPFNWAKMDDHKRAAGNSFELWLLSQLDHHSGRGVHSRGKPWPSRTFCGPSSGQLHTKH